MNHVVLREIATICANEFGVTPEQMQEPMQTDKNRNKPALNARWSFFLIANRHTFAPPRILRFFGGGSTGQYVRDCIEEMEGIVECDRELAARIKRIERAVERLNVSGERQAA